MTYATVEDVSVELRREIDENSLEGRQIQRWLDRAERAIRLRIPQLDEWCQQDEEYKATVIDIEAAAASRKALNPEGIRSIMTQIDDGNLQKTIDTSRSSGEVTILDPEWDLLMRIVSSDLSTSVIAPEPVFVPYPHYPCCY